MKRQDSSRNWFILLAVVASATAILDRFLHHNEVIAITGRSYRLRNQVATSGETPPTSKPANAPISATGSTEHVAAKSVTASAKRQTAAGQLSRESDKETESIA